MSLFDLPIIPDENCCKLRYCYPRTKKKRIRNKWKKYRFKRIPRNDALIFSNRIICHPIIYDKLIKSMAVAAHVEFENGGKL